MNEIIPVFGSIVAGTLLTSNDASGVGFVNENPATKGIGIGLVGGSKTPAGK